MMFCCQADGSAQDCRVSNITSQRSLNVPLQNTTKKKANGLDLNPILNSLATIIQFLTGRTVFWRGTFKLLCDVMSEPRQSGADPSAWQRNIISHRVNALLYGSRNGTKVYMNSQFLKKPNNLTRYFQRFWSFKYLKPESLKDRGVYEWNKT